MVLARGGSISCAVLSLEAQVLVNPELAGARVAGSENSETDDDTYISIIRWRAPMPSIDARVLTEGPQFGRDLSELAQTLGDGVAYRGPGQHSNCMS